MPFARCSPFILRARKKGERHDRRVKLNTGGKRARSRIRATLRGKARMVESMPDFVRLEILRPMQSDYYIVPTHWKDEVSFRAWTECGV
jgi:heme-degrading monooxygenase HmoA